MSLLSTTAMKQFSSVKEATKGAFTSRRQSSGSIVHKDGDTKDKTMSVPTFCNETEEEEIDISQYTPDDIKRLRLEDPFLYYSIPAAKRQLYESDPSPMNSPARRNATLCPSRRSSCPTILLANHSPGNDGKQQHQQQHQRRESVKRARRVSAEPHPSVVIKRIMNEMNIDYSDDSDMDEEDERLIQVLADGTFDQEI